MTRIHSESPRGPACGTGTPPAPSLPSSPLPVWWSSPSAADWPVPAPSSSFVILLLLLTRRSSRPWLSSNGGDCYVPAAPAVAPAAARNPPSHPLFRLRAVLRISLRFPLLSIGCFCCSFSALPGGASCAARRRGGRPAALSRLRAALLPATRVESSSSSSPPSSSSASAPPSLVVVVVDLGGAFLSLLQDQSEASPDAVHDRHCHVPRFLLLLLLLLLLLIVRGCCCCCCCCCCCFLPKDGAKSTRRGASSL